MSAHILTKIYQQDNRQTQNKYFNQKPQQTKLIQSRNRFCDPLNTLTNIKDGLEMEQIKIILNNQNFLRKNM